MLFAITAEANKSSRLRSTTFQIGAKTLEFTTASAIFYTAC